ncbi:MAG: ATP-binding protein [Hyphomonadaceae bacterium]
MDGHNSELLAQARAAHARLRAGLRAAREETDRADLAHASAALAAHAHDAGFSRTAALAQMLTKNLADPHSDLQPVTRAIDRIGRILTIAEAAGAEPQGGDPDLLEALSKEGEARARQQRLQAHFPAADSTRQNAGAWCAVEMAAAAAAEQMGKTIAISIDAAARALPAELTLALRGPLSRVLRYCCIYGVEMEALRVARGKPAAGAVRVSALTVERDIVIAVSDDGAGLDLERLRARAAALKLLPRAAAANLPDGEAAALIFAPGVSSFGETSAEAGLDRAKAEIERLGGAVEVNSLRGRGTTFLIRTPLDAREDPLEIQGAAP